MKKLILFCISMVVACNIFAQARDCRQIVLPHVGYDIASISRMPSEKLQWHCTYSANSFFVTDTLPTGAFVYDITDLVDVQTGNNVQTNFIVDLTSLSYYAYNFWDFQTRHNDCTIYFYTPRSYKQYLGVYSINETFIRTENAINAQNRQ